jgi:hypothetical protein
LCASYSKNNVNKKYMNKKCAQAINIIFKISIIFIIGFLSRSLMNYFLDDINGLIEYITLTLSMFLSKYPLCTGEYLSNKIFSRNILIFKNNPKGSVIFSNNNHNIENLSIKDKIRCKIHWHSIGQFNSRYGSYYNYKNQWNADNNLIDTLKEELDEKKRKLIRISAIIAWVLEKR